MANSGRPLSTLEESKSLIKKQDNAEAAEKIKGYIDAIKNSAPDALPNLKAIQIYLQVALEEKDYALALLIVDDYSSLLEWADPYHCTAEYYKSISSGLNTICKVVQDAKVSEALLNMRVEGTRATHEMQDQFHRLTTAESASHFVDCQNLLSIKLNEMDMSYHQRLNMMRQQMSSFVKHLDLNSDDKEWLKERKAMVEFLALPHEPESLEQYTVDCFAQELTRKANQSSPTTPDKKRSMTAADVLARMKFQQYLDHPDTIHLLNHCLAWLGRASSDMHSLFNDDLLHKKVDEVCRNQPYVNHAYQVLLDRKAMSTTPYPSADFCSEAAARGCIYALEDIIKSFAPDFKFTEDYQSRLLSLFLVLWLELEVRQFEMTNSAFAEDLMTVARNYIFAHQEKKYPELANWACRVLNSKTGDRPHLDEFRCLSVKYQTTPMSTLVAHRFAMERRQDRKWALARVQFTTAMQTALDIDLSKSVPVAPAAAKAAVEVIATAPLKSPECKTHSPAPTPRVISILEDLKDKNEQEKQRLGKENFQYTFGIFEDTNRAALSRRRSSDNSHDQEPVPQRRHSRSQSF